MSVIDDKGDHPIADLLIRDLDPAVHQEFKRRADDEHEPAGLRDASARPARRPPHDRPMAP